jgi:hypothetical protein
VRASFAASTAAKYSSSSSPHTRLRCCGVKALGDGVQVVGEQACVDIAPLKPENVRLADERMPDAGLPIVGSGITGLVSANDEGAASRGLRQPTTRRKSPTSVGLPRCTSACSGGFASTWANPTKTCVDYPTTVGLRCDDTGPNDPMGGVTDAFRLWSSRP